MDLLLLLFYFLKKLFVFMIFIVEENERECFETDGRLMT